MNQVALRQGGPAELVPAQSESSAVLSMIERAARDPAVDVDKLRQLMEMRSQVEAKQSERDFYAAMNEVQAKLRRIRADANNPQTRSKYASYAALDRILRPIYTENGFTLDFNSAASAENTVRVLCDVSHKSGHVKHYQIDMPADGKGAKGGDVMTKTHATGSAVSYGMRYLLKMIFNIAVGEDDDDGNGADASGGALSEEQIKTLKAAMEVKNCTEERLLKWASAALRRDVSAIGDLPASSYEKALSKVQSL